jgi:hypothetical protein
MYRTDRRSSTFRVLVCAGLTAVLSAIVLAGTKKDDFKDAVRGDGCKMIPYSDLSSRCYDTYQKQRDWCTGDRELGCKDLNKDDPKDRETAKTRRDNAVECLEHRRYVLKTFADTVDRLKSESSDPDPEIKSLAEQIIKNIEATRQGHEDKIREADNRRETCDARYNGR